MPADGFKGHLAIDGSLLGTARKWGEHMWLVCGAVGLRRRVGTLACDVWLSGDRTRDSAHHQEGGADGLPLLLDKVIGPIKVHVDNTGKMGGYGEEKENASTQKLAMLTCQPSFETRCTFRSQMKSRWKCSMSRRTAQRTKKKKVELSEV